MRCPSRHKSADTMSGGVGGGGGSAGAVAAAATVGAGVGRGNVTGNGERLQLKGDCEAVD